MNPLFKVCSTPVFILLIILTLLVLITCWISFAEVDRVVRAEGRVIPAGKAQIIQHLEGGIVSNIAVNEGDVVKKGDLLLTLQDAKADSQLGGEQVKIKALKSRAVRLQAEVTGISLDKIKNGTTLLPSDIVLFNARRNKLQQELSVFEQQIHQHVAAITESQSREADLNNELDVAQRQLTVINGLMLKNAASKLELLDSQSRVQRLMTQIGDTQTAIPRLRASVSEAEARMRDATAKFRADAGVELNATLLEIDQSGQMLHSESDRVSRAEVHAPVGGVVNRIYFNTIGGIVKAGEPIMELTPTNGRIVIEASVLPSDRAELRSGLPANIRIAAYDFGVYGTLVGELSEVSADTVADERGNRFYRIQLTVSKRTPSYRDKPIHPGMTVIADIVIGKRTILQYLISPLHRFRTMAFVEAK